MNKPSGKANLTYSNMDLKTQRHIVYLMTKSLLKKRQDIPKESEVQCSFQNALA